LSIRGTNRPHLLWTDGCQMRPLQCSSLACGMS
jgi:hypothetical protein